MVWWFTKKKKVLSLQENEKVAKGSLKLLSAFPKKLEPEKVKAAAGLKVQKEEEVGVDEMLPQKDLKLAEWGKVPPKPNLSKFGRKEELGPLYVKKDVYQRLLGEMDLLKRNLSELDDANKKLHDSEYNEEDDFEKLKRTMKLIHDRLLEVDKTLFKM